MSASREGIGVIVGIIVGIGTIIGFIVKLVGKRDRKKTEDTPMPVQHHVHLIQLYRFRASETFRRFD